MKRKFLTVFILSFLVIMTVAGYGGNKTLFIVGNGIESLTNDVEASINGNHNIQFFLNNLTSPLIVNDPSTGAPTDVIITGGEVVMPTSAGKNIMVNLNVGDTIYVLIWQGSYYAKLSLNMNQANYDNSTLTWSWAGAQADYYAGAPASPSIAEIVEKLERVGTTADYNVTLDVSITPGVLPQNALTENPSYKIAAIPVNQTLRDPSETTANGANIIDTTSTGPVTLKNAQTGDPIFLPGGYQYAIQASAFNNSANWGSLNVLNYSAWGPTTNWITGTTGGQTVPITITGTFTKQDNGPGLNAFAWPFDTDHDVTATVGSNTYTLRVNNIQDLIGLINQAEGGAAPVISSFGWYDTVHQQQAGLVSISYLSSGDIDPRPVSNTKFTPSTTTLDSILSTSVLYPPPATPDTIRGDRVFSIGVSRTFDITVTGYKR